VPSKRCCDHDNFLGEPLEGRPVAKKLRPAAGGPGREETGGRELGLAAPTQDVAERIRPGR
jgi:hypothetical protein